MALTLHQPCARTVGPVLPDTVLRKSEKPSPFWSPPPVTAFRPHEMDGTAIAGADVEPLRRGEWQRSGSVVLEPWLASIVRCR